MDYRDKIKSSNPLLRLSGEIERSKDINSNLWKNQISDKLYRHEKDIELALYLLLNIRLSCGMEDICDTPLYEWWREYQEVCGKENARSTSKESVSR